MIKRILFSADDVIPSLTFAASIVNAKNSLPILDNVLVTTSNDNTLVIAASDGEVVVEKTIEIDLADTDVRICLPAKSFANAIRNLAGMNVELLIDDDKKTIRCNYENKGKFEIPYLTDADTFPLFNEQWGEETRRERFEYLSQCISRCDFCMANDELRLVLNGINLTFGEDGIVAASTDGRTLAEYQCQSHITGQPNLNFTLPRKACAILLNEIKDKAGENYIEIKKNDVAALFQYEGFRMQTRLIEGRFPNYKAVIPTDNDFIIEVEKEKLIGALKRIAPMASTTTELCVFTFTDNLLTISCEDEDYGKSATEKLAYNHISGDGTLKIGLNHNKVMALLPNIVTNNVRMEMKDANKACIFKEDKDFGEYSYLCLLMPMKI